MLVSGRVVYEGNLPDHRFLMLGHDAGKCTCRRGQVQRKGGLRVGWQRQSWRGAGRGAGAPLWGRGGGGSWGLDLLSAPPSPREKAFGQKVVAKGLLSVHRARGDRTRISCKYNLQGTSHHFRILELFSFGHLVCIV